MYVIVVCLFAVTCTVQVHGVPTDLNKNPNKCFTPEVVGEVQEIVKTINKLIAEDEPENKDCRKIRKPPTLEVTIDGCNDQQENVKNTDLHKNQPKIDTDSFEDRLKRETLQEHDKIKKRLTLELPTDQSRVDGQKKIKNTDLDKNQPKIDTDDEERLKRDEVTSPKRNIREKPPKIKRILPFDFYVFELDESTKEKYSKHPSLMIMEQYEEMQ